MLKTLKHYVNWKIKQSLHLRVTWYHFPLGSHSVTCHLTQVNTPHLKPSQTGQYSIYQPRKDGRLSWAKWLVTCWDGLARKKMCTCISDRDLIKDPGVQLWRITASEIFVVSRVRVYKDVITTGTWETDIRLHIDMCVAQALSIPYCQSTWISVCMWVCTLCLKNVTIVYIYDNLVRCHSILPTLGRNTVQGVCNKHIIHSAPHLIFIFVRSVSCKN